MEETEVTKNLNLLAKSSLIVFIGIFLSKLFTYLYKIFIGRYYGVEAYGLFSLAISIVGVCVALACLGLIDGLNRFIPIYLSKKQDYKISSILKFSKKILLFTGIIFALVLFLMSRFISENIFHNSSLTLFIKIFALIIPIQIFTSIYLSYIRANEKIKAYSFASNILPSFSKFLFLVLFLLLGVNYIYSISLSYFLGILMMFLFVYLYFYKIYPKDNYHNLSINNSETIQELINYSWPLLFFGIMSSLIFWIDSFSLGILKDVSSVGIYNSAIPLAILLMIPTEIFLQLFFPMITKHLSLKKNKLASELTKQVTKWIFVISLPILMIILIYASQIINLFWGTDYVLALNALRFLAIGYFIFSISNVSNNLLSSIGKSKIILINLIFISITNLILNFIFIPLYGINGAAIATMISLIIWSVLIFIESYLFTKILPFRRKLLNIGGSIFLTYIIFYSLNYYFKFYYLWGIFIFLIIYLFILFITKSLDRNDRNLIKAILRKF